MGGRSPYNDLTFRQAEGLRRILKRDGPHLPVYVAMKNWHPLFTATLEQMVQDGVNRALGIILAPHQGEASWGRYQGAMQEALEQIKANPGVIPPQIEYCRPWFSHPLLIEAAADKLRCKMDKVRFAQKDRIRFFFTAHSVPESLTAPYVDQILQTCRGVARRPDWNHGNWSIKVAAAALVTLGWSRMYAMQFGMRLSGSTAMWS